MKKAKLGEIVDLLSGYAWKAKMFKDKGDVPIIRIQNIGPQKSVNFKFWDDIYDNRFLVNQGDLLLSLSGSIKLDYWDGPVGLLNQRIVKLKPKSSIDKKWLYFTLINYIREIETSGKHALVNNVSVSSLKNLELKVPDIKDQKRIAQVLSDCEELIQLRKQSIALLDELVKSTFLEMFGDLYENTGSITYQKLGANLKIKHGFAFKSEFFREKGQYVLLTPGNFKESGGYKDRGSKQKFYTGVVPKDYLLRQDDLLVAMTEQTKGLLGSAILVPHPDKFLHNQRLGLVEFDEKVYNRKFLFNLFNSDRIRQIIHNQATGLKVRHTSPTKIEDMEINVPSKKLQDQFEKKFDSISKVKKLYRESLHELENLYARLSQDAFKGALDLSGVVLREKQPDLSEHTLESLFESVDMHKLVAAVTRKEEKTATITHGSTYIQKTLSNIKQLRRVEQLENVAFEEYTFGMFSKQVAAALDDNPYLKSVGTSKSKHFEVRSSKRKELDSWMEQEENEAFINSLSKIINIYHQPEINNELDNIELFNTVLRCCQVLNTTDFEPVNEKMKNWKTEGTRFKNKAEKFGRDRIMGMCGFVSELI